MRILRGKNRMKKNIFIHEHKLMTFYLKTRKNFSTNKKDSTIKKILDATN